jgi:hypothetical protein
MARRRQNLSKFENTIAHALQPMFNDFMEANSIEEIRAMFLNLCVKNKIDTYKSREINLKLSRISHPLQAKDYIKNIYLNAIGLGVF